MLWILFAEVAQVLLCGPEHSSGISADPQGQAAFQASIAQVLLLQCLPAAAMPSKLPLQMAVQRADTLRQLLQSSQLSAVAKELLLQPDTGTQVAAALGSLVASLPAQLPEGDCGSQLAAMYASIASLAKEIFTLAEACQPAGAERASGGSAINDATAVGGSGSDSDPEASCDGEGEAAASSEGSSRESLRAAWGQLALQAFPKLAAALQLLAGSAGEASVGPALATVAFNTHRMLQAWAPMPDQPVAPDTFAAWAAAATAGLRLQPLLSQLDGAFQQMQPPHNVLQQAARLLSQQVLLLLLKPPLDALAGESAEEAAAAAWAQLPHLHGLACRLCHWLAGGGVKLAGFGAPAASRWNWLQWSLCRLLYGTCLACGVARCASAGWHSRQAGRRPCKTLRCLAVGLPQHVQPAASATVQCCSALQAGDMLSTAVTVAAGMPRWR